MADDSQSSVRSEGCQKSVRSKGSWGYHPCGRTLNPDDPEQLRTGLCGLHLAGQRRRERAAADFAEQIDADAATRRRSAGLRARLVALGLEPVAEHKAAAPGVIGLSLADVERVLEAMEGPGPAKEESADG